MICEKADGGLGFANDMIHVQLSYEGMSDVSRADFVLTAVEHAQDSLGVLGSQAY